MRDWWPGRSWIFLLTWVSQICDYGLREQLAGVECYLQVALLSADREKVAALRPLDGRDRVVVGAEIAELHHLAVAGAPQVDAGAESHGEHVLRGPVHQVQVEVILELWRVKHLQTANSTGQKRISGPSRKSRR